jgi:hypothetical protein
VLTAVLIASTAGTALAGYGGFGVTATYLKTSGINRTLTELNRDPAEYGGRDSFVLDRPLWWLGGHRAGAIGNITLGGGGAATATTHRVDSMAAELVGIRGNFDAGFAYVPWDFLWVRPHVEVGFGGWFLYAHSVEEGALFVTNPDVWHVLWGWTVGAAPGLEVMGRLRYGQEQYIALYTKANYFIPIGGPEVYSGEAEPPAFGLGGLSWEAGLRFGSAARPPFKM